MTSKIEGSDGWGVGLDSLKESVDGLLETENEEARASATEAEESDSLGDAAEDFWDDVKGASDRVKQDIKGRVEQAKEDVHQALDAVEGRMREAVDLGESAVEDAKDVWGDINEAKSKFVDQIDQVLESHPEQVLSETARDALDGTWDLAGEVNRVMSSNNPGELALETYRDVSTTVDEAYAQAREDIVDATCNYALEHREVMEGVAAVIEQTAGNELLDKMSPFLRASPYFAQVEASRQGALLLASALRDTPALAEAIGKDPSVMEAMTNPNGIDRLAGKVEEVDVGEPPLVTELQLGVDGHLGVGGSLGGTSKCKVEQPREGTYRVSIDVSVAASGGAGAEAGDKGVDVSAQLGGGGKLVVELSGEGAARDAAHLIAASRGGIDELLFMNDSVDAKVLEWSGNRGVGASAGAGPLGLSAQAGFAQGRKLIGGESYDTAVGKFEVSLGAQTDYLQTPDGFVEAMRGDRKVPNPLFGELVEQLPEEFTEEVSQIYGPTGGLRLSAKPSLEIGVYQPTDRDRPTRLEFTTQAEMRAGRSTLTATRKLTVTDLEGLVDALDGNAKQLVEDFKSGELSPEGLRELAEESGADIDKYVDFEALTVDVAALDGFDLNIAGQRFMEGRHRKGRVFPPPEGRTVFEQVMYLEREFDKPVEPTREQLAAEAHSLLHSAHAGKC